MLIRKLFRTAKKYFAQFLSMIIMVTLGVGVFVGFNAEWKSIEVDVGEFFEQTKYADFRVYSEKGFTSGDIEKIKGIEGVDEASRVLSVNVSVDGQDNKRLGLFVLEDYVVSTMIVTSGEEYSPDKDGFWLSDRYAEANGIKLGDELTLSFRNQKLSGKVLGLAKSGEFMICVADENQLMPDYNSFGFVYAPPSMAQKVVRDAVLGALAFLNPNFTFYPQVNIISSLEKEKLESEIRNAVGKTLLVTSKEEHLVYAEANGEANEGKTMGAVLPVLFLLIGILTMVTTMHRITANEKVQIGTLKALGFKNSNIMLHYTSYALTIGLVGAVLGTLAGYGLAKFIMGPFMMGTYFDMVNWGITFPPFVWFAVVGVVLFLTLIGFLSVKNMLKGTAADALRPYSPKKVKPLAIEKTRLWDKLSFATKWNLRDIMRHKSRSFMTLFGVVGCMILLVGSFGMNDTMNGFLDMIDNKVNNYATKINFVEDVKNDLALSTAEEYAGDWLAESSGKFGEETVAIDVYDVSHDKIRFLSEGGGYEKLSDDGVYICIRLGDKYKVGDKVLLAPYGMEETFEVEVKGVIRSVMTENITMTRAYAEKIGLPYTLSSVFTDVQSQVIKSASHISGWQAKSVIMDSYDEFMKILVTMVFLLIVAAVILGVVVLYNLGLMSYIERYRELSTLKVVGFKDRRIGKILISQNVWLTVVGVIIGLPAGIGTLKILVDMLASEYEMNIILGPLTYVMSVVLTFVVSFVVGLFVARKNKKINMVESLKAE
ncbi:MAG: ABC transporter permease [Clostridia bacterium]|nr:ABC transporter permease [Clostridia bacterium]